MNKAVMISIQPKWCELIASGKKTIEVRKTKPKIDTPFKCYIYCTNQKIMGELLLRNGKLIGQNRGFRETGDIPVAGKVIGEFVCDNINKIEIRHFTIFGHENRYCAIGDNADNSWLQHSCLNYNDVVKYGKLQPLYGWQISDLKIYDKPKELREFKDIHTCFFGKTHNCYIEKVCKNSNYDCVNRQFICLTRPPQSWCYVEELKE